MTTEMALFMIAIALATLAYSIPKLLIALRKQRTKIPGFGTFQKGISPVGFWFLVASAGGGILFAVGLLVYGLFGLVFH